MILKTGAEKITGAVEMISKTDAGVRREKGVLRGELSNQDEQKEKNSFYFFFSIRYIYSGNQGFALPLPSSR